MMTDNSRNTPTQQLYSLADLKYLMSRLREPEYGCDWDIKQDFKSLIPHTLEECYEVVDAIDKQDWSHLSQELGDLLFQIIFYSELAAEKSLFDLDQVIHGLVAKLIRRHPHVFLDGKLEQRVSIEQKKAGVFAQWDEIKQAEREQVKTNDNLEHHVLADIPQALPAIERATKLQKRAASVGFDWQEVAPVIAKIEEELAELKEAILTGNLADMQDEMGDFMFAQINLARHLNINAQEALRGTNNKFTRRFNYVEQQVKESGKDWQQFTLTGLDEFWNEAKKSGL